VSRAAARRHGRRERDLTATGVRATRGAEPTTSAAGPRPGGWWFDGLLLAGFVAVTVALLASRRLLDLDLAVRDWSDTHRPPLADHLAGILNYLGNGSPIAVIALVIAVVLAIRGRTARPVLPVLGAEILTYCVVGPIKLWTSRAAPHQGPVQFFGQAPHGDIFQSYPSGHLVNTIVWYGVIVALLVPVVPPAVARWSWLVRTAPVVVVSLTTVYLGYHWFTDTAAGILLGVFLHRVMVRVPWSRVPLPAALERRP
jgi:membrane-associated phospholipid phosphatase